ncbi:gTP-binding protein TypA/BipA [Clostridium sp. CAG:440]|nr:gTP-binding protein TypA/BipA [Clostridium sp. CAG:440]HJJ15590.1 translational GTPase TypA [Clostridiaceae bacterium]
MNNKNIRNIAIIAHVDHGKTTLVDAMLRQSHIFRENEQVQERVMDSNDQEKERGITILSKNTSVMHGDVKINIVDTPGHADFGGEVERVLKTVDGVLLLVDAFEGAMPQTREVLKKSLALGLKPIVVINKIDRPGAQPEKVVDQVIELFIELDATDEQLDFPVVYASAKNGIAKMDLADETTNLDCLFETIINTIQAPNCDEEGPAQMLVSNIDYDDYVGRIAVGRVERGIIKVGMPVSICGKEDKISQGRIAKVYTHVGLNKVEVEEGKAGDIIELAGIPDINIGDTICDFNNPEKIPFVDIDEPTVSMTFSVNNGPFAGKEGQFITSRHIRDRLFKELDRNVSLRVKETDSPDSFEVSGRGELHLSVLIETMRREGFELLVSRPKVIFKEIDGVKCEPIELLVVNVPDDCVGNVIEKLGRRKAEMVNMEPAEAGHTKIEFKIPARGLIGYRTEFLTDTKGEGTMNHIFDSYEPFKGEIQARVRGTIVAFENGKSVTYGLYNAQDKGELFIGPGVDVYEGMIVGLNSRGEDLSINVCKEKHLTNTRASGSDDALRLVPPIQMSLEKAIEFIQDDELVEVTPKSIRLRKKILDSKERERAARNSNK